jgi:hypothetical protein
MSLIIVKYHITGVDHEGYCSDGNTYPIDEVVYKVQLNETHKDLDTYKNFDLLTSDKFNRYNFLVDTKILDLEFHGCNQVNGSKGRTGGSGYCKGQSAQKWTCHWAMLASSDLEKYIYNIIKEILTYVRTEYKKNYVPNEYKIKLFNSVLYSNTNYRIIDLGALHPLNIFSRYFERIEQFFNRNVRLWSLSWMSLPFELIELIVDYEDYQGPKPKDPKKLSSKQKRSLAKDLYRKPQIPKIIYPKF